MLKKSTKGENISEDNSRAIERFGGMDIFIVVFISLLCLTCILPFLHLMAKSISANQFVIAKKVYFWPRGLTFAAYQSIFKDGSLVYSMVYSVGVTLVFTFLGMVACICASYALSRKSLRGRPVFTFLLMFPMYFSAGLIPSYLLYHQLHMLDTVWVLILPLIYSPYNMLIMKTYFQSNVSESLIESAYLDGANDFQILWKIILPLSKPIMATIALFYAVGRWNSYGDNMYFIKENSLKMVQYKLYQMVSSAAEAQTTALAESAAVTSTPEVLQAAAVMFVTIPIIIVYPFLQKYFVKGAMVGAVKG
ncbi:MAG: carbohydrate ABC transporter permease [Lachnospiraceae bacterium]|jgi:putative aldouronate transport system permease protein|nr:carbohydrate ABC transporter permease [Lachnospiraceae bacterium]